jgi:aryl-alcohol dehydrogenase-like predicted oxidoreductase
LTSAGLRWTTAQDCVDHVVVSMRRREWVAQNLEAQRNGPLTDAEQARLGARWAGRGGTTQGLVLLDRLGSH